MTARDAIQPGSIPYGERQTLEENLPLATAGPAGPGGGPGEGAPDDGGSVAIPEDPIGALLSGEVEPDSGEPSTAGLSVGPGRGPAQEDDVMMSGRAEKIRMLATEASSPMIRAAARNELRRMARKGI